MIIILRFSVRGGNKRIKTNSNDSWKTNVNMLIVLITNGFTMMTDSGLIVMVILILHGIG